MIVSPTPDQQLDQRESVYCKYKELGIQIFLVLDPKGLLRGVKLPMAKEIVKNLVRELDENHRDTITAQVMEAISLRNEWAKRYTWAPRHKLAGHQMYIDFVTEQRADEQEIAGDGETNLTPSQADFLAFLECLIPY